MLKAVIIDENATTRGLLQTILTNNGWEVVGHTNNNAKGMMMVQKFQPHFVCIDIAQIDDELDILNAIRTEWPKTLIFLISSALDAATVQQAVSRGAHGFFLKPFNQATVANTIRSAVLRLVKGQQQVKTE
ncbi:MAG: response regulator [Burkholderiaceae bacterium]|nr:response regulator [Burkholderiaceae bacterium]